MLFEVLEFFRSLDGGATWQQLPSTASSDFYFVNRLAMTADGRALIAATRSGLYRSTNFRGASAASITFTLVLSATENQDILDIACHPTQAANCTAGGRGRTVHYSADGGVTWLQSLGLPEPNVAETFYGRVEVTYAAGNSNIVYASVDRNLVRFTVRRMQGKPLRCVARAQITFRPKGGKVTHYGRAIQTKRGSS